MEARIALADDEADARNFLVRLLSKIGYEVSYAAEDGRELLSIDLPACADIVILDLDMPGMDGLETAEEVTQQGIPVILVSGHPDLSEIVVENEPLVSVLPKPINSGDLQQALEQALRRSR